MGLQAFKVSNPSGRPLLFRHCRSFSIKWNNVMILRRQLKKHELQHENRELDIESESENDRQTFAHLYCQMWWITAGLLILQVLQRMQAASPGHRRRPMTLATRIFNGWGFESHRISVNDDPVPRSHFESVERMQQEVVQMYKCTNACCQIYQEPRKQGKFELCKLCDSPMVLIDFWWHKA